MHHLIEVCIEPLGELLVERGVINHEQLNIAIEHKKKNPQYLLGEVLVELKFATERDISIF